MLKVKTIRIFISSPGDVVEERDRARSVVEELRRRYCGRLDLRAVLWEELPLQADLSFQQGIDVVISEENAIDIAVFILWSRLGSPLTGSVRRDNGSLYRSGTEREFDLMLQARAQSGGVRPAILVYTRQDDPSFDERLRGVTLQEKESLIEQRKLVERFIREEFHDTESQLNLRAYHSFDRPATFAQRLRLHLQDLLDPLAGGDPGAPVWDIAKNGPPFLGLDAFEFEHAPVFFGREDEIVAVRQLLREQARRGCAFVLLTGASGSGKSSLVRAGVLPAVAAHEIDSEVTGWRTAIFTPGEGGGDPMTTLVRALTGASAIYELAGEAHAALREDLRSDPGMVCRRVLRPALETGDKRERLLVFVDQLEELFSDPRIGEDARSEFVEALEALARSGCAWVLATVRSDFYAQCQSLDALVRMKEGGGQFDLLAPGADALDRLIRQPAALAGLRFEQRELSLADVIVRDATMHRELLPLLEYLLHRLCADRTEQGVLTFASYETLGGVEGALASRADSVISELRPSEETLDALLAALVTLSGDEQETFVRRRVAYTDLVQDENSRALVDTLVHERLLTSSAPADGGPANVTVAHEALFRLWSPAVTWLGRNREFLRLRANVTQSFSRWQGNGRHHSLLLHAGYPLEEARRLLEIEAGRLDAPVRRYVEASIAHRKAQRNRMRLAIAAGILLLAALSTAFTLRVIRERNRAEAGQTEARTERSRSDDMLTRMQLQRAEELFDSNDNSGGLAYLANVLRRHPDDRASAARLLSALRDQSYARQILELPKQDHPVAAYWHPDGQRLFTLSSGTLQVWNAMDGKLLAGPIATHGDSIRFSPDGKRFVAAGLDSQVFDAQDGKAITGLLLHNGRNTSGLAGRETNGVFSPDGSTIVTTSIHPEAIIWDTNTGQPQVRIPLRTSEMVEKGPLSASWLPSALAWSPDGAFIAIGRLDGYVLLWDVVAKSPLRSMQMNEGAVHTLRFSADSKRLYCHQGARLIWGFDFENRNLLDWKIDSGAVITGISLNPRSSEIAIARTDHTVGFHDTATGKVLTGKLAFNRYVYSVSYSQDGARLITSTDQPAIQIWDAFEKSAITAPYQANGTVNLAMLSPDGSRLAIGTAGGRVSVWAVDASQSQPILIPAMPVLSVAIHPDQRHMVVRVRDEAVQVWDSQSGLRVGPPLVDSCSIYCSAFTPDGKWLLTGGVEAKRVRVWDWKTGDEVLPPLSSTGYIADLSLSKDGGRVCVVSSSEKARVWDLNNGKPLGPDFGVNVHGAILSPDGNRVAVLTRGAQGYVVQILNPLTAEPVGDECQQNNILELCASDDGRYLATGSYDGTVRVWSFLDGKAVSPPLPHAAPIGDVQFSPDGQRLVAVSEDRKAQVWDWTSARAMGAPLHHQESIYSAAFSPDGERVATCSYDSTVRIWDSATGRPQTSSLPIHSGGVTRLVWSKDGRRLFGGGWSWGFVHVWDVPHVDENPPAWLADWAEAVGRQTLDARGELAATAEGNVSATQTMLAQLNGNDLFSKTARWSLSEPVSRVISPDSQLSRRDYFERLCSAENLPASFEAIRLAPSQGRAWATLCWSKLNGIRDLSDTIEQELLEYLRRAERLSSQEPMIWRSRALIHGKRNRLDAALTDCRKAVELDPNNPNAQRQLGELAARAGDHEFAVQTYEKVLTLMQTSGATRSEITPVHLARVESLMKLGREEEALEERKSISPYPKRSKNALPQQIDLTLFYNAFLTKPPGDPLWTALDQVTPGMQTLGNTAFDVRGVVHLRSARTQQRLPDQVTGILIKQKCKALHFLHSSAFAFDGKSQPIAYYIVHYEDDSSEEVPVIMQKHIGDQLRGNEKLPVIWKGRSDTSPKSTISLYKMTWTNPHPEKLVQTLDFVSAKKDVAPFLVAITAE